MGMDFIINSKKPLIGQLVIHLRESSHYIVIDGHRSCNDVLDSFAVVGQIIGEALGHYDEAIKQSEIELKERMARELNKKIIEAEIEATHQPPEGSPSEPHEEERQ